MPKRTGTGFKSRPTGYRARYHCGCVTGIVKYKRHILTNCPIHRAARDAIIPHHPRIETAVEKDIDDALAGLGFDVTRFSQPRESMQTAGIPDRYARHLRFKLRLWVEIKAEDGVLSIEQRAWHQSELMAGGQVVTVSSVSELLRELKARGVPITITSGDTWKQQ
jgi:hypothetical protein